VAQYIKRHGEPARSGARTWMGYTGPRDPSPRWGESGYVPPAILKAAPPPRPPSKDEEAAATAAAAVEKRKAHPASSSQNWEGSHRQAMLVLRNAPGSNVILHTTSMAFGAA
jgi:hypothetical protein